MVAYRRALAWPVPFRCSEPQATDLTKIPIKSVCWSSSGSFIIIGKSNRVQYCIWSWPIAILFCRDRHVNYDTSTIDNTMVSMAIGLDRGSKTHDLKMSNVQAMPSMNKVSSSCGVAMIATPQGEQRAEHNVQ